MKKTILLFAGIFFLTLFSTQTKAQFSGTFSIQSVVGLPDTLFANNPYTFGFSVKNVGNTLYSGSINFDFIINGNPGDSVETFGGNQVGGFTPGDSVILDVTYTFSISNNTFNIGDNVVVVWPRAINPNSAADSLTFHVFISNLNGINENGKSHSDIKIFPNPALEYVSFSSEKNKIDEVKIYDVSGRLITQSKNPIKIFTANFTQGVYIAEVIMSNGIISRKKFIAGTTGQ